jgi:photosystem II stability/assembly factor-like uncharacterized protein
MNLLLVKFEMILITLVAKFITMQKIFYCFLIALITVFTSDAQTVQILTSGTKTSLRGLCAVSDNVVWVSGSNGKVAKSIDAGITWKWFTVKGFEKNDFRDIEAFDENNAIIMAIDSPAYILKTCDGGESWKVVYENHTKGIFLDAMDFYDNKVGIIIGDPIDNKFFLLSTYDGGNTWEEKKMRERPSADTGEACFASSGTNIKLLKNHREIFITGGLKSNLWRNNIFDFIKINLPIIQGKVSTGANSIDFNNKKTMLVVGGDFTKANDTTANCFISNNNGKTWFAPTNPPSGYRSCVLFYKKKMWITCGLNGVDISSNNGKVFKQISTESFHVCKKVKSGQSVFFAGRDGKIGKFLKNTGK